MVAVGHSQADKIAQQTIDTFADMDHLHVRVQQMRERLAQLEALRIAVFPDLRGGHCLPDSR